MSFQFLHLFHLKAEAEGDGLWARFQVFAYMLLSAGSAGAALARTLKASDMCSSSRSSFCIQADIAIALGFAGFLFLGFSCLLSGFRVACFIIRGSRFHL